MWIVQLALRRPYTFIVAALLILLAAPLVLSSTPADVFPEVDIPVVALGFNSAGYSATEMNDRIVTPFERTVTTTVSNIEHIESRTVGGVGVIKIFFQPRTEMGDAMGQVAVATAFAMRSMPPNTLPPLVLKYTASNVPILQLGISSPTMAEQELNDQVSNVLRPRITTVEGAAVTLPYGAKNRQISIDMNRSALAARGLTSVDIVNAMGVQNLSIPMGQLRISETEFNVALNGSPSTIDAIGDIPIRTVNGTTVHVRDVAHVHDGFTQQSTLVRRNGEHGILMTVLKNGGASTLDVIRGVREVLPAAALALPEDVQITPMLDQSVLVKSAIGSVLHEALIAGALTGGLILLFLGNWRSTAIIAISIPLSILASLLCLSLIGQTINIMTLGGLALAVGILVDDATVTIENIERHRHMGKDARTAILDGAAEIAIPAFVSTVCICIVFMPMFLLTGVARYLFVPLAYAVVFAMLASYVISRTLVPTLTMYLMRGQGLEATQGRGPLARLQQRFDRGFERLRRGYTSLLAALLDRKLAAVVVLIVFWTASLGLFNVAGRDFFPAVDTGQIRLHVRAPLGTRIEDMPTLLDMVEDEIRRIVPANELDTLLDNIGGPYSTANSLYNNNGTIDATDAEVLISLKPGHGPTEEHIRAMRSRLPQVAPGLEFFFHAADMVSQTLNFGLAAPIDIQITGARTEENLAVAGALLEKVRRVPGAVDAYIYQRFNKPTKNVLMDRDRLQQVGLTARDIGSNMLVALGSSYQTAPTFWRNPQNGSIYQVSVQSRPNEIDSLDKLATVPVGSVGGEAQLLGGMVQVRPAGEQAVASRYGFQPAIDLYVSVDGRDLGATYADIAPLVDEARKHLPRGSEIVVRGQVRTMEGSYRGLALGLAIAVVLVYLLIVVNFQSWIDALIIMTSLPAALAGIAWMLFLTGTTLSVPALTGAIMTVGVATANSILVISRARERLAHGLPPREAALDAGATRLRPVLMTALAMVAGMLPMALALGEGAEQNAPLGRAVIGGLLFATVSTLLFVPLVFTAVHGWKAARRPVPAAA